MRLSLGGSVPNRLREHLVSLSLALVIGTVSFSAAGNAQSLTDELNSVLTTHPQISSKANSIESARYGVDAAWSDYLPKVALTADGGAEYSDNVTRLETQGKPWTRATTGQSAMTVTQNIYNGDLSNANLMVARAARDISEADLRTTRQSVLLDGTNAYIAVLQYSHLIRLATQNVHNVQDQLNLEDERIAKGAGMGLDALTAKQQLQTAKEAKVKFEGLFRTSIATYIKVFGHAPTVASMIEPVAPLDMLADTLEDALDTAQTHNPTIENALKVVEQTHQKIRVKEAGYLPTVDVVGKTDFTHDKSNLNGDAKEWSVLLKLNWDLFSGWKTQSEIASASYDHGAAMDNHLNAVRNISESVRTNWENLITARERMELLENASALAEAVVSSTNKLHAAGKETIFNVMDADNRLNDSRINYTQAYYDMVKASYAVLNAMGRLEVTEVASAQESPRGQALILPDFFKAKP
jgi:outer membrane protein, adhesin transport system